MAADHYRMTGLTIIQLTQHYVRLHGAWYREAWVRDDASGALRFVAIDTAVLGEEA